MSSFSLSKPPHQSKKTLRTSSSGMEGSYMPDNGVEKKKGFFATLTRKKSGRVNIAEATPLSLEPPDKPKSGGFFTKWSSGSTNAVNVASDQPTSAGAGSNAASVTSTTSRSHDITSEQPQSSHASNLSSISQNSAVISSSNLDSTSKINASLYTITKPITDSSISTKLTSSDLDTASPPIATHSNNISSVIPAVQKTNSNPGSNFVTEHTAAVVTNASSFNPPCTDSSSLQSFVSGSSSDTTHRVKRRAPQPPGSVATASQHSVSVSHPPVTIATVPPWSVPVEKTNSVTSDVDSLFSSTLSPNLTQGDSLSRTDGAGHSKSSSQSSGFEDGLSSAICSPLDIDSMNILGQGHISSPLLDGSNNRSIQSLSGTALTREDSLKIGRPGERSSNVRKSDVKETRIEYNAERILPTSDDFNLSTCTVSMPTTDKAFTLEIKQKEFKSSELKSSDVNGILKQLDSDQRTSLNQSDISPLRTIVDTDVEKVVDEAEVASFDREKTDEHFTQVSYTDARTQFVGNNNSVMYLGDYSNSANSNAENISTSEWLSRKDSGNDLRKLVPSKIQESQISKTESNEKDIKSKTHDLSDFSENAVRNTESNIPTGHESNEPPQIYASLRDLRRNRASCGPETFLLAKMMSCAVSTEEKTNVVAAPSVRPGPIRNTSVFNEVMQKDESNSIQNVHKENVTGVQTTIEAVTKTDIPLKKESAPSMFKGPVRNTSIPNDMTRRGESNLIEKQFQEKASIFQNNGVARMDMLLKEDSWKQESKYELNSSVISSNDYQSRQILGKVPNLSSEVTNINPSIDPGDESFNYSSLRAARTKSSQYISVNKSHQISDAGNSQGTLSLQEDKAGKFISISGGSNRYCKNVNRGHSNLTRSVSQSDLTYSGNSVEQVTPKSGPTRSASTVGYIQQKSNKKYGTHNESQIRKNVNEQHKSSAISSATLVHTMQQKVSSALNAHEVDQMSNTVKDMISGYVSQIQQISSHVQGRSNVAEKKVPVKLTSTPGSNERDTQLKLDTTGDCTYDINDSKLQSPSRSDVVKKLIDSYSFTGDSRLLNSQSNDETLLLKSNKYLIANDRHPSHIQANSPSSGNVRGIHNTESQSSLSYKVGVFNRSQSLPAINHVVSEIGVDPAQFNGTSNGGSHAAIEAPSDLIGAENVKKLQNLFKPSDHVQEISKISSVDDALRKKVEQTSSQAIHAVGLNHRQSPPVVGVNVSRVYKSKARPIDPKSARTDNQSESASSEAATRSINDNSPRDAKSNIQINTSILSRSANHNVKGMIINKKQSQFGPNSSVTKIVQLPTLVITGENLSESMLLLIDDSSDVANISPSPVSPRSENVGRLRSLFMSGDLHLDSSKNSNNTAVRAKTKLKKKKVPTATLR